MPLLHRFRTHRHGNVGVFVALGALPLMFAIGAGIDMARLSSARSKLQSAVDAAALSVVKTSGFDQAKAAAIAERMVRSNFGTDFSSLRVAFTKAGATVTADAVVPTSLTAILGYAQLTAGVEATVEYPETNYEIVLVLDTTGSMAGSKIEELKTAAAKMIDTLSATPILRDRVRIALVPFSTAVNVGPDKAGSGWIDADGKVYLPNSLIPEKIERLKLFASLGPAWKGCVETRIEKAGENFATDDTAPTSGKPRTLFVPMLAPDEPADTVSGRPLYPNNYVSNDTLEGLGATLLEDSLGNESITYGLVKPVLDLVDGLLGGGNRATGGDPNMGCDARPITPLTGDADDLKQEIALLEPKGSTNITEGVAWGQRVLSPGEPFAEGQPASDAVKKIMVLLTDGDNTMTLLNNPNGSAYSSYGYLADGRWNDSYKTDAGKTKCRKVKDADGKKVKGCERVALDSSTAGSAGDVTKAMNEDTAAACDAAKASGNEVYAIRLEVDTASSSELLSNCASDSSHYYDARSAEDLQGIFDDIAGRILKLKITS